MKFTGCILHTMWSFCFAISEAQQGELLKFWRRTMSKYALFEQIKAEIARTAKTQKEYERRIKALAKKLKI